MDINTVVVTGRLVRDAELKVVSDTLSIIKFQIASNRRFKNRAGDLEERTVFVDCEYLRGSEALLGKMTKGTKATVQATLSQDNWTTEDGTKRSKLYLTVDNLDL